MITCLLRRLGHQCRPPASALSRWDCWCGQRWINAFMPLVGYRWHRAENELTR